MIVHNNQDYYSSKEVADLLNIRSNSSVVSHMKKKDIYKDEYIIVSFTLAKFL